MAMRLAARALCFLERGENVRDVNFVTYACGSTSTNKIFCFITALMPRSLKTKEQNKMPRRISSLKTKQQQTAKLRSRIKSVVYEIDLAKQRLHRSRFGGLAVRVYPRSCSKSPRPEAGSRRNGPPDR